MGLENKQASQNYFARLILMLIVLANGFCNIGTSIAQNELPTALSGFEASELYDFEDGKSLSPANDFLTRLLFRAGKASDRNFERYSRFTEGKTLEDVIADPQAHRVQVIKITARVTQLIQHNPKATNRRRYYLAKLETDDRSTIVVAAPSIPKAWRAAKKINEPIEIYGFFVCLCDFRDSSGAFGEKLKIDGVQTPFFVTKQFGWFPDQTSDEMQIGESQIFLAKHGVDIGQFDSVRKSNNGPITDDDAKCFFQMLGASGELTKNSKRDGFQGARRGFQNLLRDPKRKFGDAVRFEGHVRRAVRLEIESRDVRRRLGFDHYYELDMFIPLGDNRIVIKSHSPTEPGGKPKEIAYEHRFPATICVTSLPCTPTEIRGKRISVDGFFFKFWNYDSDYTSRIHPEAGQVSPLVIGLQPVIDESSKIAIDSIVSVAMAVVGLGLVALVFFYRQSDRIVRNPVLRRNLELPATVGLDELPGVATSGLVIDKSTLEKAESD